MLLEHLLYTRQCSAHRGYRDNKAMPCLLEAHTLLDRYKKNNEWRCSLSKLWVQWKLVFPGGTVVKNPPANAGDPNKRLGFNLWFRKIPPGGGHGNPLQYSCLENPRGRRSLAGCSPWGHKELDTTGQLSTAQESLL